MGFKFQMGTGMKTLKWEGIGTKNLFPHTSTVGLLYIIRCVCLIVQGLMNVYSIQLASWMSKMSCASRVSCVLLGDAASTAVPTS